jgi:hypothetical protein
MSSASRIAIILAALVLTAAAASAQTPALSERRAMLSERIAEILREKLRTPAPRGAEAKAPSNSRMLMRAPEEIGVSEAPEQEAELHAVVNPADSNNILIAAIRSNPDQMGLELPIFYTRDFGETWTESTFRPSASGGGDPIFAASADGTIYFSWIELVATGGSNVNEGILWAQSTNGGEDWSAPDTIAWDAIEFTGPDGMIGTFSDKQWMAVDNSTSSRRGTLYTVYYVATMDEQQASSGIVVRRKPAGAPSFLQESVAVTDATWSEVQFSSIGVDHVGDVHVFFWGTHDAGSPQGLWHAVSRDGGATFGEPSPVGPIRFPALTAQAPDYLPQRLGPLPQFGVDGNASSPHAGNLYAVWYSNDLERSGPGNMGEPFHIYFARSIDGGASWSAPQRINDDVRDFRADHFHPSVDVGPTGAVVVTWYDGRQKANNEEVHYYTSYSLDGGATFEGNVRVSTAATNADANIVGSFGIGDYTKCLSTAGYAIPVWVDGRENDGDLNVFAAFVPLREGTSGVEHRREISATARIAVTPNPASTECAVVAELRSAADIRIEVADIEGRTVVALAVGRRGAGTHRFELDSAPLAPGRYFVRIVGDGVRATAPLEIVR